MVQSDKLRHRGCRSNHFGVDLDADELNDDVDDVTSFSALDVVEIEIQVDLDADVVLKKKTGSRRQDYVSMCLTLTLITPTRRTQLSGDA